MEKNAERLRRGQRPNQRAKEEAKVKDVLTGIQLKWVQGEDNAKKNSQKVHG